MMTFDRSDFTRIQLSLAAAIVMIAAGAGIAKLSDQQLHSAMRIRASASSQLNEYEGKLRQVRAEENEIKEKSALYSNLRARGVIGEEQRLDWVELIKDVREHRKLLDVQYEFAPQKTIERAALPGFSFKSSTMRLQMKLLHEGDLINFINDLRRHAKAYVRVQSCNVTRVPRSSTPTGDAALLTADCQLDWITILPAKGAS
jgi:hypothetical protein